MDYSSPSNPHSVIPKEKKPTLAPRTRKPTLTRPSLPSLSFSISLSTSFQRPSIATRLWNLSHPTLRQSQPSPSTWVDPSHPQRPQSRTRCARVTLQRPRSRNSSSFNDEQLHWSPDFPRLERFLSSTYVDTKSKWPTSTGAAPPTLPNTSMT